ncbi:MAG TPA: hypothetical protein VHS59_01010, partial [Bacillota bacterium]|nr:hypothetical protein [Bacillota bacterium]
NGFVTMTNMLQKMANEVCGGRLAAFLEGGYDLGSVGYSVAAMLSTMAGLGIPVQDPVEPPPDTVRPQTRARIDNSINIQKKYWKLEP